LLKHHGHAFAPQAAHLLLIAGRNVDVGIAVAHNTLPRVTGQSVGGA